MDLPINALWPRLQPRVHSHLQQNCHRHSHSRRSGEHTLRNSSSKRLRPTAKNHRWIMLTGYWWTSPSWVESVGQFQHAELGVGRATLVVPQTGMWIRTKSCVAQTSGNVTFYTGVGSDDNDHKFEMKSWPWVISFSCFSPLKTYNNFLWKNCITFNEY